MEDIKSMSLINIHDEMNELWEYLHLTRETSMYDKFNWNGLDYWDADRRHHKLSQEVVLREIIKTIEKSKELEKENIERKKLIGKFQRWLDTNPREQIIAAQCATIAEEYHQSKLKELNEWTYVHEQEPPNHIQVLAKSPVGTLHLTNWRESYKIFHCQTKDEDSFDWQWKIIH